MYKIAVLGDNRVWFTYPFMAKALVWKVIEHYAKQQPVHFIYRTREVEGVEYWVRELCRTTWLSSSEIDIDYSSSWLNVYRHVFKKIIVRSSLVIFIYGDKKKKRDTWIVYERACEEIGKPYHAYRVRNKCREIRLAYTFSRSKLEPLECYNLSGTNVAHLLSVIWKTLRELKNKPINTGINQIDIK